MVVLVDIGHVEHWCLLIDIPDDDLSVHGAACENHRLSWVPGDLSHAVWHLNVQGRLLRIEGSSEGREDADDGLMLAPRNVVSFAVSDGKI